MILRSEDVLSLFRLDGKDVVRRTDFGGGTDASDFGEVDEAWLAFLVDILVVAKVDGHQVSLKEERKKIKSVSFFFNGRHKLLRRVIIIETAH